MVSFPVDLLLGIPGIGLSAITLDKERAVFQIGSNDDSSPCPKCNSPSLKVHSRYSRTILDLPFSGISAEARLSVRKFFCASEACQQKIFSERFYQAALTLEWSNGQVEGQVNRLKTLKRQMYGRAGFKLLRKRILFRSG